MKLLHAAAATLACAALVSHAASPREIVVGQVVDYAGPFGEASRDYVAGAKVYFDSLNSRGGVNGMRIRHIVLDGGGAAEAVKTRSRELLDERRADVLFGYVGDAAVAIAAAQPEIRGASIALVAPLAGKDSPRGSAEAIFFTRPNDEAEIRQVVAHFRALQLTRFAVLKPEDLADVEAVHARNAQALIVEGDTVTVAEFVKRYRPRDPGAMIVALSTVNHRVLFELLGPKLAHGVMITQVVPNPSIAESPLQKEHLDAIRMFRDEPPSHLTLEGFIAAKALVEGIRRAGASPSRASILAAFQNMGRLDLHGLVVDFTPKGRVSTAYIDIAMIRRNGTLLQ